MTKATRKSEFAKAVGLSPSRVSQLISKGLPVLPGGLIDHEAGSQWLAANLDQTRRNRWQEPVEPVARSAPEAPSMTIPDNGQTLNQARKLREQIKVQREALLLDKERGNLVPRELVERFLRARGILDRDSHLAWAARTATLLASEFAVDAIKLHARLEEEMRLHLITLAETAIPEEEGLNARPA